MHDRSRRWQRRSHNSTCCQSRSRSERQAPVAHTASTTARDSPVVLFCVNRVCDTPQMSQGTPSTRKPSRASQPTGAGMVMLPQKLLQKLLDVARYTAAADSANDT